MLSTTEVDALEILVLVDNVTDSLSSNPPGVQPEWSVLLTGGNVTHGRRAPVRDVSRS